MAKIEFGKPELTCITLEKSLNLKRGDVKSITVGDSEAELDLTDTVSLTPTLQDKISKLLGMAYKL